MTEIRFSWLTRTGVGGVAERGRRLSALWGDEKCSKIDCVMDA